MKWSQVRWIFGREVRDQLRDRRTLFMIAVLPLLLYPLIGMAFLQVAQFLQEHPSRIYLVGANELPASPRLLADGQIEASLFSSPDKAKLISLTLAEGPSPDRRQPGRAARRLLAENGFDAVVYFPPQFGQQLQRLRQTLGGSDQPAGHGGDPARIEVPRPAIFYTTAKDRSLVARDRIGAVLDRWRQAIVDQTLLAHQLPIRATSPFDLQDGDVAEDSGRRAAVWSKMLPFVMLIWALTGAFYPAIDLCAGEKERGTLETLLSSPAQRSEIVLGKLMTIMLFSVATALLNLLSMTFTAAFIVRQLSGAGLSASRLELGPPPLAAVWWLVLALVPISALFSALSLALATIAQHQRGPVLPDATAAGDHAAAGSARPARGRADLGNQPHPRDGRHASAAQPNGGWLPRDTRLSAARDRCDTGLLPAGHSLGHRSVQQRIRAVPRGRAPGPRALAAAPGP